MNNFNLVKRAQAFAHEAHDSIKQVRKYTGEPYWVHTDDAANILASVTNDKEAIAGEHLHDVVEDVWIINPFYSLDRIRALFGERVALFVYDLTDVYTKEAFPQYNRAKRKQLENERIGKIQPISKSGKLADIISNTKSIVEYDKDFARVYLREIMAQFPYLSDGNPDLFQGARTQAVAAMARLGM
jgi:(p)ppGpp synthase/HD superfamily hydrolase